ncbi:hypothetical protein DMI62_01835 [Escherichia coli]|nr:hypothetical protein [Escherichia coli]
MPDTAYGSAQTCRHDKTRQASHQACAPAAGCSVNALSGLRFSTDCRHDKTRQRRIRHCAPAAGCGVNACPAYGTLNNV